MASPVPDEAVCPCGSEWFRLVDDGVDDDTLDEILDDPDDVPGFVPGGVPGGVEALEIAVAAGSGAGAPGRDRAGLVALTGSGSVRAYAGVVVCSECQRPWAPGQRHLRLVN